MLYQRLTWTWSAILWRKSRTLRCSSGSGTLLLQHTDYQPIDRLVALEPLNVRKPWEMLVEINKLKPANNEQYTAYFFLQRLPREVRILLSQEPVADC
jgi:hypothetical protein